MANFQPSRWSDSLPASDRTAHSIEVEEASRKAATPLHLLVVDDDEVTREICREVAEEEGMRVFDVSTAEEALEILNVSAMDLVLADIRLPGSDGMSLLRRVTERHSGVAVVMLTQYGTIDTALEATRIGALDFVTKPFKVDELRNRLSQVVQRLELRRENKILREQLRTRPGYGGLIGVSGKMERVYRMIEKSSQRDHPVLILGESGTGKELVARSIHFQGPRRDKPFVPVDCSSLPSTLIESELFGYVKGAFTGAVQSKQGLIEAANGGTLFLDEIGDMPLEMQSKLLRALQQKEVRPVGSTERRLIDVRVLAATNRDLDLAIKSGAFRQDLFYRLNVVQIKLPPLRERKSDIHLLVTAFLERYINESAAPPELTDSALQRLTAYEWPGNVRELENVIERAVALGTGPYISAMDLPSNVHYSATEELPEKDEVIPLEEMERRMILRTLRQTEGDKLRAAKMLGIGKTTLYRKLKQYNIEQKSMATSAT